MTEAPLNIPWIERKKIEARVLVPLVKAFQAELGEERANQIARRALDGLSRELGKAGAALPPDSPIEKVAAWLPVFAAGDTIDVEVIKRTSDTFEFNVSGCRYAEFYKQLGEPELGFLLLCAGDWATTEGLSPDLEFTRSQTIMQGASHCDFRYRLKKSGDDVGV